MSVNESFYDKKVGATQTDPDLALRLMKAGFNCEHFADKHFYGILLFVISNIVGNLTFCNDIFFIYITTTWQLLQAWECWLMIDIHQIK